MMHLHVAGLNLMPGLAPSVMRLDRPLVAQVATHDSHEWIGFIWYGKYGGTSPTFSRFRAKRLQLNMQRECWQKRIRKPRRHSRFAVWTLGGWMIIIIKYKKTSRNHRNELASLVRLQRYHVQWQLDGCLTRWTRQVGAQLATSSCCHFIYPQRCWFIQCCSCYTFILLKM